MKGRHAGKIGLKFRLGLFYPASQQQYPLDYGYFSSTLKRIYEEKFRPVFAEAATRRQE